MAASGILRKGLLLNGWLRQSTRLVASQQLNVKLNPEGLRHFSRLNATPQSLCLLQDIKNPELMSLLPLRSLHQSRAVQEAAKKPIEASNTTKAAGDVAASGASGSSTAKKVSSSFLKSSSKNLHKSVRLPLVQEGGFSFFSVRSLFSTPYPFMVYGLGGLIPFVAAPYYMQYTGLYHPGIAYAQLVYGATILSFLGGVAWGENLPQSKASMESLGYSISLPLIGWGSVLVHPNPASFLILMSGIAFAGYMDTQNKTYPKWFKNLRFLLSSVVFLCLFSTLLFRFTKPMESVSKKDQQK